MSASEVPDETGDARRARPARRVVEARRPAHDTFCNILLLRERQHVALLVHALDDLRIEFDADATVALIDALVELSGYTLNRNSTTSPSCMT